MSLPSACLFAFGGLTHNDKSCTIKLGPVSREAYLLVATEGSCFNDGKFKFVHWTTASRTARELAVTGRIIKSGHQPRRKNQKSKVLSTRTVRRSILRTLFEPYSVISESLVAVVFFPNHEQTFKRTE